MKRPGFKFAVLGLIILFMIITISQVGGMEGLLRSDGSDDASPKRGGTLSVFLFDPTTLDAVHLFNSEDIQVGKAIYDGLVAYDPKTLETIPKMAESWDVSSDAKTFTFHLKKGIKFHNGRECLASDFVYSWNRAVNPKTASELAYHFEPIEGFDDFQAGLSDSLAGLSAPDDYTLEVRLSYPYADFATTLGHAVFYPVPKEEVKRQDKAFYENPVGTGPFKFKEWKRGERIVLERFEDYCGKIAYLDSVVFKVFNDETTGYMEFEAGNLGESPIPIGRLKEAKKRYGERVISEPALSLYFYGFNTQLGPFKDNPDLRRAIAHTIDREAITKAIFEGSYLPATGILPKGMPGFQEDAMDADFDLGEAAELLERAGYPKGEGLVDILLSYNVGLGHDRIAQAIQANAKEVGIDFDISGFEVAALYDKIQAGELSFYRMGWTADYPTADCFLYPLFYSKNAGYDNLSFYKNPDLDEMLIAARGELDSTKRIEMYRKIERLVLNDMPYIPIAFYGSNRIIAENVEGYIRTGMEETPYDLVWLSR
ncbi:MAG: ABC transporter substrate-binding protein [Actinomycetota bacterium]|nr:ABC transporter substrate-binding protein [Actinomycetota bacterium]